MTKANLGEKRVCPKCSAHFYDLGKNPATCPKCKLNYDVTAPVRARRKSKPIAVDADDPLVAKKAEAKAKAISKKPIKEIEDIDLGEFEDIETIDPKEEIEEIEEIEDIESLDEIEEVEEAGKEEPLEDAVIEDDSENLIDAVDDGEGEEEDEDDSKAKGPAAKKPSAIKGKVKDVKKGKKK